MSDFTSPLAEELAADVRDRFVRYAAIDTQAAFDVEEVPSSKKQLDLTRLLADELKELGAEEIELDDHGMVYATVPATDGKDTPVVGFLAHVDTSPDAPSVDIKPQVVRWEGSKLPLPGNPEVALDPAQSPHLNDHVGHEIVTSDGTTLLGADDKAGVAEIMTAVRYLLSHPEVPHGKLRVAFTTDEEVGHGARVFDIDRFGARCAYTIDGSDAGHIDDETFSAHAVRITFRGFNIHPGYAKDRLVNSIKLAARFLSELPFENAPEHSSEREGYIHPGNLVGSEDATTIDLIIRDFDTSAVEKRVMMLRDLAESVVAGIENASFEFEDEEQYLNMQDHLRKSPEIVEAAEEAVRRAGLTPRRNFVRGGTDGSILTERGLPTPNIFCGSQDVHSVREWACVHDMAAAVVTIVNLAQIWSERSS